MNKSKLYYVYVLQDSTEKIYGQDKYGLKFKPFYVGKGQGNRSKMHEYNAEKYNQSHNFSLLAKLQNIRSKGGKVIIDKLFFSKNEVKIYNQESELIHYYGLKHKDGILLNASYGKAGGWGGKLNPTYDRIEIGTHNFQTSNPQIESPKVRKLTKMIKEVTVDRNIMSDNWLKKSNYKSLKSLRIGIDRIISRDKLSYKLIGNILKKV